MSLVVGESLSAGGTNERHKRNMLYKVAVFPPILLTAGSRTKRFLPVSGCVDKRLTASFTAVFHR